MRFSWLTVVISAFAHLLIIFLLFFAWNFFDGSGGSGDAGTAGVSVWVSAGTPESSSFLRKQESSQLKPTGSPISAKGGSASGGKALGDDNLKQFQSSETSAGGNRSTFGTGLGQGTGQSAGNGSGGDPLLAKIRQKIEQNKFYPATAKKQGIQGSPNVTFSLSESGEIRSLALVKSCGHEVLDQAALETIKRAAPLPYYPGTIALAVRYSIE